MRWKWKLGFLLVLADEIPILLWIGIAMNVSPEVLAYLATVLTALLLAMLAVRPSLFAITGLWLVGVAAVALYLRFYMPPALAIPFAVISRPSAVRRPRQPTFA